MKERLPFHALPEKQRKRRVRLVSFVEHAAIPAVPLTLMGAIASIVEGSAAPLLTTTQVSALLGGLWGLRGLGHENQEIVGDAMERRSIRRAKKRWLKEQEEK